MTQARPSPNTTSTPTQRSTPTINPSPNPDINQSLFDAVKEGNIIKVFEALNNGADVNHIDNRGSVFSYAVASFMIALEKMKETTSKTLNELIEKEVIDRDKIQEKFTSYILMGFGFVNYSNLEIIKLLLAAGADVNLQDNEGKTALMYAAELGLLLSVDFFLTNGADPDLQDNNGRTALMYAIRRYENIDTVRLLLVARANVNLQDNEGKTALWLARNKGYTDIERLLREAGATE